MINHLISLSKKLTGKPSVNRNHNSKIVLFEKD